MELTHNYKWQATFSRLRTSLAQRIVRFVNQNPDVFEAIARTGAPFGGSASLPASRYPNNALPVKATQDELAQIQQQLQLLTQQVARLHTSLNELQRTPEERPVEKTRKSTDGPGTLIGIDRYRALQRTAQLMA